jgi:hypothetical protein
MTKYVKMPPPTWETAMSIERRALCRGAEESKRYRKGQTNRGGGFNESCSNRGPL